MQANLARQPAANHQPNRLRPLALAGTGIKHMGTIGLCTCAKLTVRGKSIKILLNTFYNLIRHIQN